MLRQLIHRVRCLVSERPHKTVACNVRFTFSSKQHETRRERECEGYIRLVFHTLNRFSAHLEALGDMSVNQSRVKGNKNDSNVASLSMIFTQDYACLHSCILCIVHISPKVSTSTRDKNVNQA